jgi:alpha-beta hydrolase superfamily lysophospholipase
MRTDFYYPSRGAGMIHGCRWMPQGNVKGIVQIVHGIGEFVERYDDLANFFCRHGILVVAEDHMGHGGSVGDGALWGYFHGGWFAAVEDIYRLMKDTMAEYPHSPYVLYGHSMGSFMVRTILCRYPDAGLTGAVICGTGWQSGAAVVAGKATTGLICTLFGERKTSGFLQKLMFGGYTSRIRDSKTRSDWLTRDDAVVSAYEADSRCGCQIATAGLLRDLMHGIDYVQRPANLRRMDRKLLLLLIEGACDPVANYGKAANCLAHALRRVGVENVTLKTYPQCRHELHNELNKQEVYDDVLNWIERIANSPI